MRFLLLLVALLRRRHRSQKLAAAEAASPTTQSPPNHVPNALAPTAFPARAAWAADSPRPLLLAPQRARVTYIQTPNEVHLLTVDV